MRKLSLDRGLFFGLLAILLWSTAATAFKFALQNLSVKQVLLVSVFTSTVIFLFYNGILSSKKFLFFKVVEFFTSLKKRDFISAVKVMLTALLNPFCYYLLLFAAYSKLEAQVALSINYLWPIILVVLLILTKKIEFNYYSLISVLVSFLGFLLIVSKGDIVFLDRLLRYNDLNYIVGIVFACLSGLVWAFSWLISSSNNSSSNSSNNSSGNGGATNPSISLFFNFFVSLLALIIFLMLFEKNQLEGLFTLILRFFSIESVEGEGKSFLAAIYIGFFEMGITFLFWQKALILAKNKVLLSNIVFLSPLFSIFWISLFLNESIELTTILGLSIIIMSILSSNLKPS